MAGRNELVRRLRGRDGLLRRNGCVVGYGQRGGVRVRRRAPPTQGVQRRRLRRQTPSTAMAACSFGDNGACIDDDRCTHHVAHHRTSRHLSPWPPSARTGPRNDNTSLFEDPSDSPHRASRNPPYPAVSSSDVLTLNHTVAEFLSTGWRTTSDAVVSAHSRASDGRPRESISTRSSRRARTTPRPIQKAPTRSSRRTRSPTWRMSPHGRSSSSTPTIPSSAWWPSCRSACRTSPPASSTPTSSPATT